MKGFLLGVLVGVALRGTILAVFAQAVTTLYHDARAEIGRAEPWMVVREPEPRPEPPLLEPPLSSAVEPQRGERRP